MSTRSSAASARTFRRRWIKLTAWKATMADRDQLFDEFRRSYEAGGGADPREWLQQVEGSERDELRRRIEAYREEPPRRYWDPTAFQSSRASAALSGLDQSLSGQSGMWPTVLPRLRDAARI